MAANAQTTARFSETRHRLPTTAALVVLFWIAAAGVVGAAHTMLEPVSPAGGAVATIAAIVLGAYCYTRFCARAAGISHALAVGIAWLVLGITTELVMAMHLHHGWYAVLGSPDRPLLRNVFFFVWIFSPALFARRDDEE
jgi:CHASE2 domain-containing sensor protein